MLELNDLLIKSNEINFMMTAFVTNENGLSVSIMSDLGRAPKGCQSRTTLGKVTRIIIQRVKLPKEH